MELNVLSCTIIGVISCVMFSFGFLTGKSSKEGHIQADKSQDDIVITLYNKDKEAFATLYGCYTCTEKDVNKIN